jgi:branched-chain amino acid transport system permease protein
MRLFIEYTINAASLGILYAILALGIGLIFGIMRLVNFAHGAFMMAAGYALFFFVDLAWPLALMLVTAITVVLAVLVERVAFRPLRGADGSTLLITSFTVAYLLQSLVISFEGSGSRAVPIWPWVSEFVSIGGIDVAKLDLLMLVTGLVLLLGLWLYLTRTRTGLAMRAAAEDFQMLRLLGGRADRVIAMAFAISGVLAAVAGVLLVSKTAIVDPFFGVNPVLIAFVATVVGGLGSLMGAVVGGLLIGVLTTVLQAGLPTGTAPYRDAFLFGSVIALLVLRPQGILGNRSALQREV